MDLPFLSLQSTSGSIVPHAVYQAHVSIVICGWSDTQWTGYTFSNTGLGDMPYDEEDVDEDSPRQDYFASENGYDTFMNADKPEWDARKYWLRLVSARCKSVLQEWTYLVRTIEDGVETWVSFDSDLHVFSMNNFYY